MIEKLKEIISQKEYNPTPDDIYQMGVDYDYLIKNEPLNWKVANLKTFYEYPFQWKNDIEEWINEWKKRVLELEGKDNILKPYRDIYWRKVVVCWYERIPFEHYKNKRLSAIRNLRESNVNNNPTIFLAKELNLNPSQIRYIYIKLLLENKITIEDFKLLCGSKNTDIDLYWVIENGKNNC